MKVHERGVLPPSNIYFYTPLEDDLRLFLSPTSWGHYFCDENYQIVRENYGNLLLLFLKNGRGYVYTDGHRVALNANDGFLLDCRPYHQYGTRSGSSMEIMWIHIDGALARPYFEKIAGRSNCAILHPRNPRIIFDSLRAVSEQFAETAEGGADPVLVVSGVARNPTPERGYPSAALYNRHLVTILTEFMLSADSHARINAVREDVLAFINNNIQKPLSLKMLAEQVSLSPYHFARRFKAETGYTPHQYVLISRINLAKHYLKTTPFSIKEIAFSSGFSSESGFCIAFKHFEGTTPTAYRLGQQDEPG